LVIEHESLTRNLFLKALKAENFYAVGAENGQMGLQQAWEQLPDLIICGTTMPETNGYNVLTALRQNPTTAIIPFIFVTSKATQTELHKAMKLGANDYLTKACSVEELLKAVITQLEKQAFLRQCYAAQSQPSQEAVSTDTQLRSNLVDRENRREKGENVLCANATVYETVTRAAASPLIFPSNAKLNKVFRFIEANYHQSITLGDVAQAVGYSPAYLTHLTRRQTGQTVQRWIIERRMAAARSLLLETDQVVEQIAMKVGYHNSVHFFRQFRQFHGTTPQAWRSSHRN
jgi:YesN/AraC family two-component response regulator